MLDAVFQSIEKVITDFSWKRILVYLFIVASLMGSFAGYEIYTRSFELARLEKITYIIKSVEPLTKSEVKDVKELASIILVRMKSLLSEKETATEPTLSPSLIQSVAGAAPWLLFLLIYTPIAVRKKEEDWEYGVLGLAVIAAIVAVLAYIIPTNSTGWIRFGAVQLANVLILAIFHHIGNKTD